MDLFEEAYRTYGPVGALVLMMAYAVMAEVRQRKREERRDEACATRSELAALESKTERRLRDMERDRKATDAAMWSKLDAMGNRLDGVAENTSFIRGLLEQRKDNQA